MKLVALLNDATGAAEWTSERQKYHALSAMLAADESPATPKAIGNWFQRNSIPAHWLFAIARAAKRAGRDIDLNNYA